MAVVPRAGRADQGQGMVDREGDDNFQVDELLVTIVFDQSAGDHCEEQVEAAPHEAGVN